MSSDKESSNNPENAENTIPSTSNSGRGRNLSESSDQDSKR